MSLVQDRCICLRKVEYSETSQILTLLARDHGIVKVIARGAHRRTKAGASKFDGGIDLLDVGEAVISHHAQRELSTLTEWSLREGHPDLRRTLRGLYLAFYAAELVSFLIEEQDPHPQLFEKLERALGELSTPRAEQAFLAFQLQLLRESGYLPEIFRCSACGKPVADRGTVAFDPGHGGVLCRACEGSFPHRMALDGRLLAVMQYVLSLDPQSRNGNGASPRLPSLTRHQTDPINGLFAEHVEHTLGRRLRMPRWILSSARGTVPHLPTVCTGAMSNPPRT